MGPLDASIALLYNEHTNPFPVYIKFHKLYLESITVIPLFDLMKFQRLILF